MRPQNFNDILAKVPDARQSGEQWIAPCLAPGHRTPSGHLSLKDAKDKALVTCQGGRHSYQDICQALEFDSLTYSRNGGGTEPSKKKLVATFSYEYEKGKEAYQIRRFDLGNGDKTFEVWHKEFDRYVAGMGEYKDKPILYHLPEIPDWIAAGKRIYIPEGELKSDSIIPKGGAATTSPFGAGRNKWRPQYSEALTGAKVIILPDNDKPGHDLALDKAASLYGKATSLKVLDLPGLPAKDDIIDWFNAGGTFEQLEQLADNCPEYEPPPVTVESTTNRATLEEAVLALVSDCDGAITKDGHGLNKFDVAFFHSLADSIGRGQPIADELRPKVKRKIVKYERQLHQLGININDVLLEEEPGEHDDGQAVEVQEQALIPRLADAILQDNHFARDQGGKLYYYRDGAYRPRGSNLINRQVKILLDSWRELGKWSSHLAEEVVKFIQVDLPILWEQPRTDTVSVLNGLLNMTTLELHPHTPDFLSCIQIPVTYDPNATCPAWDKFICEVFPEDALPLGYEIPAYLMIPDTSVQKAFLLIGEGGNGKSTYLEAVRAFLDKGNTASLSLQKLESDRFATARLVGKLANICPDLPSEHLASTSTFKAITGGDSITAEYKFHDSFDFPPYARLIFSVNHIPRSSDSSQAFFDRWLVVPFNNRFRGEKTEIPRAVLDALLSCPNELSGLLNRALVALQQIRSHSGFTESKSMKAAWDEFRVTTDPLAVWLSEDAVENPDAIVTKKDLMTAYNREAERRGQPRMTDTAFGRALHRLRPQLQDAQRTISGKLSWVWLGIGLKSKETINGDDSSPGSRSFLNINRAGDTKLADENSEESNKPVKEDKGNRVNRVNSVNPPDNNEKEVVVNSSIDNAPDYPCRNCGCSDYWRTDWNIWQCSRCHPKPNGGEQC